MKQCKECLNWDKELERCDKEIHELDDTICLQRCICCLLIEIICELREGEDWKL